MIHDIGIVDTKKIISAINEAYAVDFSGYALTAFKRRVLKVMNDNNYSSIVDFIHRMSNDPKLFEKYLSEGLVDTTEMFRDPSFWRDLRDIYIPDLVKTHGTIRVLIPGVTSGDEVYSFMILLREAGFINKVKILATGLSQIRLDNIQKGYSYDMRKIEISEANYKRFSDSVDFSNYYKVDNNKVIMQAKIVEGLETKKYSFVQSSPMSGYHLILYRNRMIYLNATLQDKVSQNLFDSLVIGGILCFGAKEYIDNAPFARKLAVLNQVEKVYKKRIP